MSSIGSLAFEQVDVDAVSPETERCIAFLESRCIGQGQAVQGVANGLKQYRSGIKDPTKPIGIFTFLGPTGWGKTLLVETLADFLIPKCPVKPLIKVSGESFTQGHQLMTLIGAPPSYVGFNDIPLFAQSKIDNPAFMAKLVEAVRKQEHKVWDWDPSTGENVPLDPLGSSKEAKSARWEFYEKNGPYVSVILIDECEKMSNEIDPSLLSLFDKAEMYMANGDRTDFSHSVIALTSNVGAIDMQNAMKGRSGRVGFSIDEPDGELDALHRQIFDRALEALGKRFAPEFIGRIRDQVHVFRPLLIDECVAVVNVMLGTLERRVQERLRLTLCLTQEFKEFIVRQGYSREHGLRRLQQMVNKYVGDPVATLLETGQVVEGDELHFLLNGDRPLVLRRKMPLRRLPPPLIVG